MSKAHIPAVMLICLLTGCAGDPSTKEQAPTTQTATGKSGIHEMRDKDGVLVMRGEKVNGVRQGEWLSFFPDGSIRSRGNFVDSLQHGATTVYYEDGTTYYTGHYKKGQPVDQWIFFSPEGTPEKVVRYNDQGMISAELRRSLR